MFILETFDSTIALRYAPLALFFPLHPMQKVISALLTASAVMPIFFSSVVSNAESKCADSSWHFRPATTSEANAIAASVARAKFCAVVEAN